jgi:hypothetical protein
MNHKNIIFNNSPQTPASVYIYMERERINLNVISCNKTNYTKKPEKYFSDVAKLFSYVENPFSDVAKLFGDIENPFSEVAKLFGDVENSFNDIAKLFGDVENPFSKVAKSSGGIEYLFFTMFFFNKTKY